MSTREAVGGSASFTWGAGNEGLTAWLSGAAGAAGAWSCGAETGAEAGVVSGAATGAVWGAPVPLSAAGVLGDVALSAGAVASGVAGAVAGGFCCGAAVSDELAGALCCVAGAFASAAGAVDWGADESGTGVAAAGAAGDVGASC